MSNSSIPRPIVPIYMYMTTTTTTTRRPIPDHYRGGKLLSNRPRPPLPPSIRPAHSVSRFANSHHVAAIKDRRSHPRDLLPDPESHPTRRIHHNEITTQRFFQSREDDSNSPHHQSHVNHPLSMLGSEDVSDISIIIYPIHPLALAALRCATIADQGEAQNTMDGYDSAASLPLIT